jgi:hypothetical protein
MKEQLRQWLNHPVTKVLVNILEENKKETLNRLLNTTTTEEKLSQIERLKVFSEVLDIETLLEGELDNLEM